LKGQQRLEPCFCGSGNPKNECCGSAGNRILNFNDKKLGKEIKEVRRELYEFIVYEPDLLEEGFADSVFSDYMDFPMLVSDQDYLELFLDWLAFGYKNKDGGTPFSQFLEARKEEFRPELYRELAKWKQSYLSAYRVDEILTGGGIILRDIFIRERKWLSCSGMDYDLVPGDVMIARLLQAGNWSVTLLNCLVFPDLVEEPLLQDVTSMREKIVEWGMSYSTWESFFRNQEEIMLTILCACFEESEEEDIRHGLQWEWETGIEIRRVLKNSRPELGHISPRELSFSPEGKEKLRLFFSRLERGDYDQPGLNLSELSRGIKTLMGLEGEKAKGLSWEQEKYFDEACLLARRMMARHFPLDIEIALFLWESYTHRYRPGFRKPGSWSAAIDFFLARTLGYRVTQEEVAKHYSVSTYCIASKIKNLEEFVTEEIQKAASTPGHYAGRRSFSDMLYLFR